MSSDWRARAERLRAFPLQRILALSGARPDPRDPCKWRTARGVLSVRGAKFFNWRRSQGGGGAIDLVIHLHQLSFHDALLWLEQHAAPSTPGPSPANCAAPIQSPGVEWLPAPARIWASSRSIPRPEAVLCESAIDALSCHLLYPQRRALSTPGARPNPAWIPQLLDQGCRLHCGFDLDSTGQAMAQALIALHPSIDLFPPPLHDWNDALRAASSRLPQ